MEASSTAKARLNPSIALLIAVTTDPLCGVKYEPGWRMSDRVTEKVLNDDRASWSAAYALSPCSVAYVWHAGVYAGIVERRLESAGFIIRSQIIWK